MSKTKPERIYLTDETGETTWCQDKITDEDTEYVRLDLAQLPDTQEQGWQPISTAPRDGTAILGCYWNPLLPHLYNPITIVWASYHPNAKGKECWRTSAICGDKANPTHWRPLPEPPQEK